MELRSLIQTNLNLNDRKMHFIWDCQESQINETLEKINLKFNLTVEELTKLVIRLVAGEGESWLQYLVMVANAGYLKYNKKSDLFFIGIIERDSSQGNYTIEHKTAEVVAFKMPKDKFSRSYVILKRKMLSGISTVPNHRYDFAGRYPALEKAFSA